MHGRGARRAAAGRCRRDPVAQGEGDFSPIEATRYPRLEGVERSPTGPVGSRWTDAKVIGGAEIVAAIGPAWEALGLHRIAPVAGDPAGSTGGEPLFASSPTAARKSSGVTPPGRI